MVTVIWWVGMLGDSAGSHVLDEAERSLHDALCVLSQTVLDSRVVFGGGWPEMQMAGVVLQQAARTPGKKSLAMESFAHALRAIPATICDNAGQPRSLHSISPSLTCMRDVASYGSECQPSTIRLA